jgi:hypothetical protein
LSSRMIGRRLGFARTTRNRTIGVVGVIAA